MPKGESLLLPGRSKAEVYPIHQAENGASTRPAPRRPNPAALEARPPAYSADLIRTLLPSTSAAFGTTTSRMPFL